MLKLFGWGPLLQPEVRNVRCYPLNAWSAGGIQADRWMIRRPQRQFRGWFHVKHHSRFVGVTSFALFALAVHGPAGDSVGRALSRSVQSNSGAEHNGGIRDVRDLEARWDAQDPARGPFRILRKAVYCAKSGALTYREAALPVWTGRRRGEPPAEPCVLCTYAACSSIAQRPRVPMAEQWECFT